MARELFFQRRSASRTHSCRETAGSGKSTSSVLSPAAVRLGHWIGCIGSMRCKSEQERKKRSRKRTPNNRTTTAFRLSDELWAVLEPLLPARVNTHRFGGGRPRVPDRRCADAIFYVLRTGCQWEALNQTELCAKSTAHDRYAEWVAAGVFLALWRAGVARFDELRGIEWAWLR